MNNKMTNKKINIKLKSVEQVIKQFTNYQKFY